MKAFTRAQSLSLSEYCPMDPFVLLSRPTRNIPQSLQFRIHGVSISPGRRDQEQSLALSMLKVVSTIGLERTPKCGSCGRFQLVNIARLMASTFHSTPTWRLYRRSPPNTRPGRTAEKRGHSH